MTELNYHQTLQEKARELGFKFNIFNGYVIKLNDGSQILCESLPEVHGALEMLKQENSNDK